MDIPDHILAQLLWNQNPPGGDLYTKARVVGSMTQRKSQVVSLDVGLILRAIDSKLMVVELRSTCAILWHPDEYISEHEYEIAQAKKEQNREHINAKMSEKVLIERYVDRISADPEYGKFKNFGWWASKLHALYQVGGLSKVLTFVESLGELDGNKEKFK